MTPEPRPKRPRTGSGGQGIAAAVLLLLLLSPGCTLFPEKPIRLDIEARTYPADDYTAVKRVLLLPFSNETSFEDQARVVERAFAQELADRGCFETVPIPEEDVELFASIHPFTNGRFSLTMLIELGEYYHVDAVLLGCLKMCNPYAPPLISLKADLIAVNNGEVLRTVAGILDARDGMVARDIMGYFEEHCAHQDESLYEWRIVTSSPRMYARYACNRFVNALHPDI